jgi:hypothetical protein
MEPAAAGSIVAAGLRPLGSAFTACYLTWP